MRLSLFIHSSIAVSLTTDTLPVESSSGRIVVIPDIHGDFGSLAYSLLLGAGMKEKDYQYFRGVLLGTHPGLISTSFHLISGR